MEKQRELVQTTIQKLKFFYDIQGIDFWYLGTSKISVSDTELMNDEFVGVLGENFYELTLELGASVSGGELAVELYKLNETLSRLFKHQRTPLSTTSPRNSEIASMTAGSSSYTIDSTLILKTISKLLMMKLTRLLEMFPVDETGVSPMESKLLDDILVKNISHRMLGPYHKLLYSRAITHINSIY